MWSCKNTGGSSFLFSRTDETCPAERRNAAGPEGCPAGEDTAGQDMGCILFHPARELLADEIFIPDSGGVGRALYLVQRGSRKRERRGDLQPGRGDRRPFQNGSYLSTLLRWLSQQAFALPV